MTVSISFSVLMLVLSRFSEKTRRKKSLTKRIKAIPYYSKAFGYTVSHSSITVERLPVPQQNAKSPSGAALRSGAYSLLFSLFYAYLLENAQSFEEKPQSDAQGGEATLIITQRILLIHLLSGLLISAAGRVKNFVKGSSLNWQKTK